MTIEPARADDVETYAALGRDAQEWLRARGSGQYVPVAHDEYAAAIRARVEGGTLFAVRDGGAAVAFFTFDPKPSPWWPDDTPAMYLGGMVVAHTARGHGVGDAIIRWCVEESARRGRRFVRLDCYAGNPWLCAYYEARGFVPRGRVEQHPGYEGCLYERDTQSGGEPCVTVR